MLNPYLDDAWLGRNGDKAEQEQTELMRREREDIEIGGTMTAKQLIKRLRELTPHDDPIVLIEDVEGYRHEISFAVIVFAWDQKRIVIVAK
jgi:hypothetical protein